MREHAGQDQGACAEIGLNWLLESRSGRIPAGPPCRRRKSMSPPATMVSPVLDRIAPQAGRHHAPPAGRRSSVPGCTGCSGPQRAHEFRDQRGILLIERQADLRPDNVFRNEIQVVGSARTSASPAPARAQTPAARRSSANRDIPRMAWNALGLQASGASCAKRQQSFSSVVAVASSRIVEMSRARIAAHRSASGQSPGPAPYRRVGPPFRRWRVPLPSEPG